MFSRAIILFSKKRVCSTRKYITQFVTNSKKVNDILVLRSTHNDKMHRNKHEKSYKNETLSNKQKKDRPNENIYRKIFGFFLFSASISSGISVVYLKKKYFSTCNNWIPSVCAASPFHTPNINKNFNQDESNVCDKKDIRKTYNFIADAAEKVSGGVVFIAVKDNIRRDYSGNSSIVSNGSGFIIEADGLIMTNAHVVGNKPRASTIVVRLADGREFEGKIEELDAITDLALVRIDCKNLKSINLGTSVDLRAGEFVVAVGSPLSLSNSVTSGVISSVGRKSKELGIGGPETHYLQTDATITFGNSGGPLINLDGDVIGINSMKVDAGISFAIPVDYAKDFLEKAKKKRTFMSKRKIEQNTTKRRRYMGITMFNLSPELILELQQRADYGTKIPHGIRHGLLVSRVVANSPSYYAGLSPGDVITHINGKEIHSIAQAYVFLEEKGDLDMVVIRGGLRYSVAVAPE